MRFFNSRKIKFFLIFLSIFLLTIFFYLFNNQFKIKEIEIRSEKKQILNGVYLLKDKNIFFLNEKEVIQTLLKNNSHLSSIQIEKKFPNKLIIYLSLEKAVYIINADKGFFLINKNGKIIEKRKTLLKSLPVINFYQKLYFDSYSLGDVIEYQDILTTLKIIEKVLNLGYIINTVDIVGKDMVLFKINTQNEEKKIYFSLEKNIDFQYYQLEFLLKQLKIRGQVFKEIDLRFKKPVIKK